MDRLAKALTQAHKSAQALSKPDTWKSIVDARKHYDTLRALDPETVRLDTDLDTALDQARTAIERRIEDTRSTFWPALKAACEPREVRVERITQDPFEVRLGCFTAVIDLVHEKATLHYAREPVARRDDLAPDALLDACAAQERTFLECAGSIEERFERIATAYRMARAEKRIAAEEFVDLVDLLPLYALCTIPEAKRRTARLDVGAMKAQLAFDLAMLRQEGALTRGDVRLVLGSATGRSASNKKNVLYVENASGEGQYYLGLALRRVPGGTA
ncbi:MAG: hypothetical protein H6834_17805 [Planctomycetes bacterium]|nr:hypothetical protein [Planctomycetota bacterium]